MRRREKKKTDRSPPEPPEPGPASAPDDETKQIQARLGTLESLGKDLDGWRKETSAQLARLTASLDSERDSKEATTERLDQIEERLSTLIALTEMISMDDNPFVRQPKTAQEAAPPARSDSPPSPETSSTDPSPEPEAPPMHDGQHKPDEESTTTTEHPTSTGAPPDPQHEEDEAHPDERAITRRLIPVPPAGVDADEHGHDDAQEDPEQDALIAWDDESRHDEDEQQTTGKYNTRESTSKEGPAHEKDAGHPHPDESGEEVGRRTDRERALVGRYRAHPNDPAVDAFGAPTVLSDVGSARPTSAPVSEWSPTDQDVSREAHRRLRLLHLGYLIARHLPVREHAPYLGAYTASGWITRQELTEIQPFVQDLVRSSPAYEALPRHILHERTILLLTGHPLPEGPHPARAPETEAPAPTRKQEQARERPDPPPTRTPSAR